MSKQAAAKTVKPPVTKKSTKKKFATLSKPKPVVYKNLVGEVEFFNDVRGFGYIWTQTPYGEDSFRVSFKQITGRNKSLRARQMVTFDAINKQAMRVRKHSNQPHIKVYHGTVITYDQSKGYGFIEPESKNIGDIFFHAREARNCIEKNGNPKPLVTGERVAFQIGINEEDGRTFAVDVKRFFKKNPKTCEIANIDDKAKVRVNQPQRKKMKTGPVTKAVKKQVTKIVKKQVTKVVKKQVTKVVKKEEKQIKDNVSEPKKRKARRGKKKSKRKVATLKGYIRTIKVSPNDKRKYFGFIEAGKNDLYFNGLLIVTKKDDKEIYELPFNKGDEVTFELLIKQIKSNFVDSIAINLVKTGKTKPLPKLRMSMKERNELKNKINKQKLIRNKALGINKEKLFIDPRNRALVVDIFNDDVNSEINDSNDSVLTGSLVSYSVDPCY